MKIWILLFPESATKMKPPSSTATPLVVREMLLLKMMVMKVVREATMEMLIEFVMELGIGMMATVIL